MTARSQGSNEFDAWYAALRGRPPFPWMSRLADAVLREGWPEQLALPTGTGKSEVALVWAWVRECDGDQPRRLWIVSDRRVIVDQAYEGARVLEGRGVLVSRLRGGVTLDMESMLDLTRPQVVSCTVDQYGSRLLFRGYGVSPRAWPIHAALAGTDSLVVLDEAHLSPNAETTFAAACRMGAQLRVVSMTATPRGGRRSFGLAEEDRTHPVLSTRLRARRLVELQRNGSLAKAGLNFLRAGRMRIALVANTVRAARACLEEVHALLAERNDASDVDVALLTGRQRPLDPDRILENLLPVLRSGSPVPDRPVIVVTTQAIEAGADLDFDAMVSEGCPIDALMQRLGRLDRLGGMGESVCVLLGPKVDTPPYGAAPARTWEWLGERASPGAKRSGPPVIDLGFEAWSALQGGVTPELRAAPPRPVTLTDVHLKMLARTAPRPDVEPEVGLFLHGPERASGAVSVIWRKALLDDDLKDPSEASAYLELLPPLSTEACPVPVHELKAWLRGTPVMADAGDVEGGAAPPVTFRAAPEVQSRRVLRWDGRDGAVTVTMEAIRAGDVIVLRAAAGGYDAHGWAPDATEPVQDLAEAAATAQRGYRILQTDADIDDPANDLAGRDLDVDVLATARVERWARGSVVHLVEGAAAAVDPHREVALDTHQARVAAHAQQTGEALGLDGEVLFRAGCHHDDGKATLPWQIMAHAGDPALVDRARPLAKGRFVRSPFVKLPRGWRHERESLRRLDANGVLNDLEASDRALVRWLVATHHGHARPFWPVVASEQDWTMPALQTELHARMGPWRLALHEAALRLADWHVSREEAEGRHVAADERRH